MKSEPTLAAREKSPLLKAPRRVKTRNAASHRTANSTNYRLSCCVHPFPPFLFYFPLVFVSAFFLPYHPIYLIFSTTPWTLLLPEARLWLPQQWLNSHVGKNLANIVAPGVLAGGRRWSEWCLFDSCITSQQHASVSQGQIYSDNCICCHKKLQTFYLTQSQYTDTRPTSPSADPVMPGTRQGSHWSATL